MIRHKRNQHLYIYLHALHYNSSTNTLTFKLQYQPDELFKQEMTGTGKKRRSLLGYELWYINAPVPKKEGGSSDLVRNVTMIDIYEVIYSWTECFMHPVHHGRDESDVI